MTEHPQAPNPSTSRGTKVWLRLAVSCAMAAIGSAWAASPAAAGVNFWTSAGPSGGGVVAVVPDLTNPRVVYAATALGGVFKSTDGGASWQGANRGLANHLMLALAVDPLAPGTLYASSNDSKSIFVSHDGAATWTPAGAFGPGLQSYVSSLAVDPTHAGTVYAGDQVNLWVSHDGGGSWTQAYGDGTVETVLVAADPARSAVFAFIAFPAFSSFSYTLLETVDGGVTWNDLSASLPAIPNGYVEISFAIEPAAPGNLYIAVTRTEADTGRLIPKTYRSADGGATWQGAGTGGYPLAAAANGLVVSGSLKSADHGVTWTPIAAPPDTVGSFAIAPGGTKIYAAGSTLGVLASTDGGRSWQAASQGLAASSVLAFAVDPQSSGTLYAATAYLGLLKSRNSGGRWRLLDTGLPPPVTACCTPNGAVLATDPAALGTLFYVDGFGAGALNKSADAGASWTQLPLASVGALVPDPSSPAILYAICYSSCMLQKSTDGGQTWSCLSPINFYELVVSPAAPATLYALASYSTHALYKSTDAGASWAPIDAALPLTGELAGLGGGARGHLAVDPTNAARLYVSGPSGVWMTQDGGVHWSPKNHGLPHAGFAPLLTIDPHGPLVVYAAHSTIGVYRSRDGGSHWQPILGGLPPLSLVGPVGEEAYNALVVDPTHSGTVYLATQGNGVLTYTAP
jgi:photosystem II stability/assembly factor-like uncharacterized protein